MYQLLYDRFPFPDYESMIKHEINFSPPEHGQIISAEAKNLISLMLTVDSQQRPAAHELLNHDWFSLYEGKPRLYNEIVQYTDGMAQTLYQSDEIQNG